MKIRSVKANNRKRSFEVSISRGVLSMPYGKLNPEPTTEDPVKRVYVDPELGREGFTYELKSGAEGSLHIDSVLEYNEDPDYLRELLVHRLTVEAQKCMEESPLPKREVIRRARTSPAQFYRLMDPSNNTKSIDKLLVLLGAMDCEVDFVVRHPSSSPKKSA